MSTERHAQKARTRAALLEAARALSRDGQEITVQAVARHANISKATAYRYFSDSGALAAESALDVVVTPTHVLLGDETDVRLRVHRITDYFRDFGRQNEATFRRFLAATLSSWSPDQAVRLRGARRIPALEKALDPVRDKMSAAQFRTLVLALSAGGTGFEQHIALTDVCGLSTGEGDRIGRAIVDSILDRYLPST